MTKNPPLFSIIIPVYGVEAYLVKCLDSVVNQTCGDWECICVNDGSPDNCGKILDEYKASFKGTQRLEVIHQPNGGVSAARNAALNVAKGEWVQFLDADDSLKLDFLERISKDISFHSDVDAIEHTAIYCHENGKILENNSNVRRPPEIEVTGNDILADPYGIKYTNLARCSCYKIFRRSVIEEEKLRFTNGICLGEDSLFAARFYAYANKVAICPNTSGYLRIFRDTSAIHNVTAEKLLPKLKTLEVLYDTYEKKRTNGLEIHCCANIIAIAYLGSDQKQEVREKCIEAVLESRFYSHKAIPFLLMHGTKKARLFALAYLVSPKPLRRRILRHFSSSSKQTEE